MTCKACGSGREVVDGWCGTCREAGLHAAVSEGDSNDESVFAVQLTTTNTYPNREVEKVFEIITAECVFGMNVFRDFFAGFTDFFGGRSSASQKVLRNARKTCLNELKKEAYELGADGVIGVDLDYSEISGKGKGMLFLVASGTAVKFKE